MSNLPSISHICVLFLFLFIGSCLQNKTTFKSFPLDNFDNKRITADDSAPLLDIPLPTPISLLPCPVKSGKGLSTLPHLQLLFNPQYSAFRPHLEKVTSDFPVVKSNRHILVGILFDLYETFDLLDHSILEILPLISLALFSWLV